jgi:hypothetical protein
MRIEISAAEVLPLYGRLLSWGFVPMPTKDHEVFTMMGRSGDAVLHANCMLNNGNLMVYGYSQAAINAVREEQEQGNTNFPQSAKKTAALFAEELASGGHSM